MQSAQETTVAQEATAAREAVRRVPSAWRRAFDGAMVVGLLVVAHLARRGSLPTDGLWFDDSWVAAGAVHGRFRDLMTVGSGHPGFTAILMVVDRAGGSTWALGLPSLIVGVVTPAVLYVALRRVAYARSVAALVSAALAVSTIHVLYSGRVKGYVLDTLLVLVLAMVLPVLARRTWSWRLAAGWTVGAVALGTFSGYVLLASAIAGVMLVLHPASDRRQRVVAVGAQAVVQGMYFLVARSKTDLDGIEEVMESEYDGHLDLTWHPVDLAREVLKHLRRLAEVYPAGAGDHPRVLAILAVVSMAGLIVAALRGRDRTETLVGRFLLTLVVVAFLGASFDRFPFGTSNLNPVSPGGRHILWMVPALVFGLVVVLARVRAVVARWDLGRFGFDAVAVGFGVWLVVASYQPADPAPFQGGGTATRFIEDQRRPGDLVIVTNASVFSFAVNSTIPVTLVATPSHQVGFAPVFDDPDVRTFGGWSVDEAPVSDLFPAFDDVDRVLLYSDGPLGYFGVDQIADVLERKGFSEVERRPSGWATAVIWER